MEGVRTKNALRADPFPDPDPAAGSGRTRWLRWTCSIVSCITAWLVMIPSRAQADTGVLTGGSYRVIGVPGGGGLAAGGPYAIRGWVASAGAGTSRGDGFDLTCGLFPAYQVTLGAVTLHVAWTADGLTRVWWSGESAGYLLESATTVGRDAAWQAVQPPPAANSWLTAPAEGARFYRLRKP